MRRLFSSECVFISVRAGVYRCNLCDWWEEHFGICGETAAVMHVCRSHQAFAVALFG